MNAFITSIAVSPANLKSSSAFCPCRSRLLHSAGRAHKAQLPPSRSVRRVSVTSSSAPSTSPVTASTEGTETMPLVVMVNGLPGKMAASTAEEVLRRGLILAEEAMTGDGMSPEMTVSCDDSSDSDATPRSTNVQLQPPSEHSKSLARMRAKYGRMIVVDFTHPKAANVNVEMYAASGVSFVIGTTGGDDKRMKNAVMNSKHNDMYAVIAPNMGKQIVAFQAMMKQMSEQFPGVFSGYTLTVTESHQSTKADTSGTAKAVVESLCEMGVKPFTNDDIRKLRNKDESKSVLNVPEEHLDSGHAYHTYHLSSPDNTVHFEFQHNVCGRSVYASGTVDAVQFLDARKQRGEEEDEKRVFSMIDILQSGSMS